MKLTLESVHVTRANWSLSAHGEFQEGVHLVTGVVGSGKSTLALMIAGITRPSSGSILQDTISSPMISFQFPEYHVTGSSIGEEITSWGLDPEMIAARVNLIDKIDTPPLHLSRGELKRLHLECILSGSYDLLILDEPFSSLDCIEKVRICRKISLRQTGITIIFTHEQAIFPKVNFLWEIEENQLCYLGRVPEALCRWSLAPKIVRDLIAAGRVPKNISPQDIEEAACRT
jgi:energy-coupling factor transport system ATP-binding protein